MRNIDADSFELRLKEPNYKNEGHIDEVISYVVIEVGTWTLSDGTLLASGSQNSNTLSSAGLDKVSFADAFNAPPAVLTQVQTYNGADWVTTRTDNVTGQSFDLMMQEEERLNAGSHVAETIGWLATAQGASHDQDTLLEGGVTADVFTNQANVHSFKGSFDLALTLLTKLTSFNGSDPAIS